MGILKSLATFAFRGIIGEGAVQAVQSVSDRLTDQSKLAIQALQRAGERAWKSLEVALAGESLLNKIDDAEDKQLRLQVRSLLETMPLPLLTGRGEFRRVCLQELQAARKQGLLLASVLPEELAHTAGEFARQGDPAAIIERERAAIRDMGAELEKAGYKNLAWLVNQEVQPGQQLLVLAFQFFFRRAVETNDQLSRGLQFTGLEQLSAAQAAGFRQLEQVLDTRGQKLDQALDGLMAVAVQTRDAVLDIQAEQRKHGGQLTELTQLILRMMEQVQMQQRREVRPGDSCSIRGSAEKQRVRELVEQYRSLPEDQRQERPALLHAVGMLQVAAGDSQSAQRDFEQVARLVDEPHARAQAHHNAYQAALERRDFGAALAALRQAVELHADFAPFSFTDYAPERILGAGGFGVAFLCQHATLRRPLVVKTLRLDGLDRDVEDVFREAQVLNDLDHPAIIRLRDCRFADAARTRPYLVMDYFESVSLAEHVRRHGPLAPAELLPLARATAEALRAAHDQSILHRDVKPDNLLVRREQSEPGASATGGPRWRVKLIDFGLAVKQETAEGTVRNAQTPSPTPREMDYAGTFEYAAPEQMGRLPGVAVGAYSDVYGFGRTCYYALLGTPEPDDAEKETLEEGWRKLLSQCTARRVENRPADFGVVLERLRQLEQPARAEPPPRPAPEPKPRPEVPVPPLPKIRIIEKPMLAEAPPARPAPKPAGLPRVPPRTLEQTPAPKRPGPTPSKPAGSVFMGPQEAPTDEPEVDQTPPPRGRRGQVGSAFLDEQDIEELPLEPDDTETDPPPPTDDPPKPKRGPLGGAFGL